MKVHLPIVGKATGSSAGLIYQSYWGNTYTRSFPFIFHYPDTAKQHKCQFDFFKVQRAWWPIYNQLKLSIPKQCRRNTNVYNVLSNGIYNVLMTYSSGIIQGYVKIWGLDKRNTVKIDIEVGATSTDEDFIRMKCDVNSIIWKRHFNPSIYHILLFNLSTQEFLYKSQFYVKPHITEEFINTLDWQSDHNVIAYLAFSNREFLTNFNLCAV